MALTPEEKKEILRMIEELDKSQIDIILASLEAFRKWLFNELNDIYQKVKNGLQDMWRSVRNFFS
jgi:isopropylmalate/homocitrate/citramalate synthase